ncbi:MAG: PH domain-containing protein [Candidatus Kapaibacterium sp.]
MQTQYTYRHDVYWRATSMYAGALIAYACIRGWSEGMSDGRIAIVLADPLLILLFAFAAGSALALCVRLFLRRTIIIDENGITIRDRFRERRYAVSDVARINFGKERVVHLRGMMPLVKIRLHSRRRYLRIRPSAFTHEKALLEALHSLNDRVHAGGSAAH